MPASAFRTLRYTLSWLTSRASHSSQNPFPGLIEGARETASLFRALSGVLGVA